MKKTLTLILITTMMTWALNTQATSYDQANWYLSVDVEQIRSKVLPLLPKAPKGEHNFTLEDNIPHEFQKITMYGHSEQEDDVSFVVSGQLEDFSLNEYIINTAYLVSSESPISLFDTSNYHGALIQQYQVKETNKNFSFYSAKIGQELMVLSFDKSEVENWIDQKYSTAELYQSDLVSLLVNIESAMAQVGADLSNNNQPFNSTVFKKITQFSASVYESDENLAIDSVLSTADEATAKQLAQVINGLVAMNALSDMDQNKPVLAALLAGLNISNQGKDLLITTAVAYSLLPQIEVD